MFQKIIEFFKRLFGGGKTVTPPTKPTTTAPKEETKKVEELEDLGIPDPFDAQDGSEITPDTIVHVVNEEEPVIIDPTETEEKTKVEPEVVTTPPETNPVVEETPTEVGTSQPQHTPRYLWCLDNGHGKKTAGKRSPKLPNGDQLLEYEFNRDIVKRIMESLDKKGVKYYNVVPEVDTDNFLDGRVNRANSKKSALPKLFVSVHSNAAPAPVGKWSSPSISGIETWFFHNSSRGRKVAAVFQKHLIAKTGWKNRHIKSRASKQFFVLRKTNMTAVLTENGFYNNKEECKLLLKDSVRQKIADAHVNAIMEIEEKGIV